MRSHCYLVGAGLDFADPDAEFARLLDAVRWLTDHQAHRARLGLHELLVNIRSHAYEGGPGPIDVAMTATPGGLTVTVTDWGRELPSMPVPELPLLSEHGGYGLAIIHRAFDEVEYRRGTDQNRWTLRMLPDEARAR